MTDIDSQNSVESDRETNVVLVEDVIPATPTLSSGSGPGTYVNDGFHDEEVHDVQAGVNRLGDDPVDQTPASDHDLVAAIAMDDDSAREKTKLSGWSFKPGSLSARWKHKKSTLRRKPDFEVGNENLPGSVTDTASPDNEHDADCNPIKSPNKLTRQPSVAPSRHQMSDTAGTGNIGGTYQIRKFVAQGLLDFALLTANASQMKNLLEFESHPYYKFVLTMLTFSIVIQFAVPVLLVIIRRLQITSENAVYSKVDLDESLAEKEQRRLLRRQQSVTLLDDIAVLSILVVTIINVLIATFISHGRVSLDSDNDPHDNN